MDSTLLPLTAASIALVHVLFGPDHYLPFVALARSRGWSRTRTLVVTALCGLGHVGASLGIGLAAAAAGWSASTLAGLQGVRGDVAAWLLVGLGLAYALWGLKHRARRHAHTHVHSHADGTSHSHEHAHSTPHLHAHATGGRARRAGLIGWSLFVVFLFGPCEPLVPLVFAPAATRNLPMIAVVVTVFSLTTLASMLAMVLMLREGWMRLAPRLDRETAQIAAGAAIACCGMAMLLGL
jgi:sulfite exporter TauE/SafE